MGKRRGSAAVHHEAAECDMWLSTNSKIHKTSKGSKNCKMVNQMFWPAKESAAAVKQTSLLKYFVTQRKHDTSPDCVPPSVGSPTSNNEATPIEDMSCELSTTTYKSSDSLYRISADDSEDLCFDSNNITLQSTQIVETLFFDRVRDGCEAVSDLGRDRTSRRGAAGCQDIADSDSNCSSLQYAYSCKTASDITRNLQSSEITADSDNSESVTDYRVAETQNKTLVSGYYSAVADKTVVVQNTLQDWVTDLAVVPESLEAMTCAPSTVKSQFYATCIVQDSLEVASCDPNSMKSEPSNIVTIPDSLVESSCFCEEEQIHRQSEQDHCAFNNNTVIMSKSIAPAAYGHSSLNTSSIGDKISSHQDLDPFMLDSVELDSNMGRITNTQKVNLFEMELELMKQYPGDVSELASLESTQSLV